MRTHLEDYIHNLYTSIGITTPADIDMLLISRRIGVEVSYRRKPFRFDNEIILIRGTKRKEWMLFGHEVGHYLRHSGSQLKMNPLFIELQEWQADNFMYHFCVPSFMLNRMDLPPNKDEAAWLIHETFNVEFAFAEKRLDKWLQQREGLTFQQKYAKELS